MEEQACKTGSTCSPTILFGFFFQTMECVALILAMDEAALMEDWAVVDRTVLCMSL
jgi:hypothetical protein